MKFTVQLFIFTQALLLISADKQCDSYLVQCNLFKERCNPTSTTVNTCCDMTGFQAPSAVYQMRKCASGCGSSPHFTTITTDVYCDMNTTGGGWIVIQRNRQNSEIDFDRDWVDYENGFGDLETDFWYGLKKMHCLTAQCQWEMRVDFQKQDGSWSYIHYNEFRVGNASDKYRLSVGGYTGVDGDYFTAGNEPPHDKRFTTQDSDNDLWNENCAVRFNSGWWHHSCFDINPNIQPPQYNHPRIAVHIEMKIRPKTCIMG